MCYGLCFALTALLLFCGCGKGGSSPGQTGAAPGNEQGTPLVDSSGSPAAAAPDNPEKRAQTAQPAAAAQQQPVQPIVVPERSDPTETLAQLTQALRKFSMEQRRVPKSFSEVVAAGYVQGMPPAPPGKQFAIDPKHLEVIVTSR